MTMYTFQSSPEMYRFCSLLGQCSTDIAAVYLGRYISNGALVALKKYNMEKISRKETQLIQDEIILMRQLSHPNILPCLAAYVSGHDVILVSPLMGYGSCHDLIMRNFNTGLPESVIAIILRDVLQALNYIHRKGIIHRAVRASHILVSEDGYTKLSGLRYAGFLTNNSKLVKQVHSFPSTTMSNLNWLSPELLAQNLQGYNEKSDVYSVGITACELANGVVPFADTPTTVMLTEKVRGMAPQLLDCTTYVPVLYEDSSQGNILKADDVRFGDSFINCRANDHMREYSTRRFSEPFHDLNEMCCLCDPEQRPTPAQLLSHSFFKQIRRNNQPLGQLLLPAIPIMEENVPDMQDDLESLSTVDKLSCLELSSTTWNF